MRTDEEFQQQVRKRNLRVLEYRRRGESYDRIAERCDISRSRVGFILQEIAEAARWKKQRTQLLESIRTADDLDHLWPVVDLIPMIAPQPYYVVGPEERAGLKQV